MDDRALVGGQAATVLSGLLEFCVFSVSTCLSRDAGQLCVSVGLGSLSALSLLLSFFLLVYERCRGRRENPEEITAFPYSLLGNLCGAVGAALAGLLHIQVLLGAFAAALDALHFICWCFHVFLCWNSKSERRRRMMRGRRRQHLLTVCTLTVLVGFLRAGLPQLPVERPLGGRRLLHAALQDKTEILGYSLGLLSFIIACTSRFPMILRTHRGHVLTPPRAFSRLLSSLAAALYAAAVLVYDRRLAFLLRVMPWVLAAVCGCALDLFILILHWLKRQNRLQLASFFTDGEESSDSEALTNAAAQTKAKSVQKLSELNPYMDVSIRPAREFNLQEVTSGMKEEEGQILNRKVRVNRVGSFCSSDTSLDSSVSSDLEWDFEEENTQWIKMTTTQFLQQGWSVPPRLSTFARSVLRPLSSRETREAISAAGSPKETAAAAYSQ
ncbi:transmembrane protein 44 isoform X1 [Takifugu flavidus]|uniref:transmembrane protein 44 isoform X1 n=1 Tax=Takifugu flavidus TaxID=433684 RepID=UPI002544B771|nr:transmembrane protein 44 isoform X1 [Takifugu flavidus]